MFSLRFAGRVRPASSHWNRHIACFSSTATCLAHRAIVYKRHGQPAEVLSAVTFDELPAPHSGYVNVRFLLSPINPADVNTIEGVYPSKPSLLSSWEPRGPVIGDPVYPAGNEGLAEVTAVASDVQGFEKGDRVVLTAQQSGTWSSARTFPASFVTKIPSSFSDVNAATATVNPATAYNMLHDFVGLKPGEWVLQNGANSAVGQAVIQIAKQKGWRTINLIRNRPDLDRLKEQLHGIGADIVLTYDELADKTLKDRVKASLNGQQIRLMLNCVGGKHVPKMVSLLGYGAYVVSYGAMSKEPLPISTGSLIFKDIRYHGFWQSRWYRNKSIEDRQAVIDELAQMKLQEPAHEIVTLSATESDSEAGQKVKDAIAKMGEGRLGKKILLKVEDPLV